MAVRLRPVDEGSSRAAEQLKLQQEALDRAQRTRSQLERHLNGRSDDDAYYNDLEGKARLAARLEEAVTQAKRGDGTYANLRRRAITNSRTGQDTAATGQAYTQSSPQTSNAAPARSQAPVEGTEAAQQRPGQAEAAAAEEAARRAVASGDSVERVHEGRPVRPPRPSEPDAADQDVAPAPVPFRVVARSYTPAENSRGQLLNLVA